MRQAIIERVAKSFSGCYDDDEIQEILDIAGFFELLEAAEGITVNGYRLLPIEYDEIKAAIDKAKGITP